MLPVIDLCTRLGLKPVERNEKARIIVISTDDEDVGLIVDRVNGVIRALPESIKPAPEHVEQGADFLRGIVRQGDKLHIVLDLHKAAVSNRTWGNMLSCVHATEPGETAGKLTIKYSVE